MVLLVRQGSGSIEAASMTQAGARWSKQQTPSPEGETTSPFYVHVRKWLLAKVIDEPGLKGQVRERDLKRTERTFFAEDIVCVIG